jgi:hypothetical protein
MSTLMSSIVHFPICNLPLSQESQLYYVAVACDSKEFLPFLSQFIIMLCNKNRVSLVVLSPMQSIHANAAHFNFHASDFRSDRTETYNAGFLTTSRSHTSCNTQVIHLVQTTDHFHF